MINSPINPYRDDLTKQEKLRTLKEKIEIKSETGASVTSVIHSPLHQRNPPNAGKVHPAKDAGAAPAPFGRDRI